MTPAASLKRRMAQYQEIGKLLDEGNASKILGSQHELASLYLAIKVHLQYMAVTDIQELLTQEKSK
jgi:hypothetical protein